VGKRLLPGSLLATYLSELGFRAKGGLVETSAQDIFKLKDPASDFQAMFESAKGGTLFIDEAYRFSPAKAGQQPKSSNQVLDYLLEAVEKQEIRESTTVILAGYRDESEDLLAYNVGFASRFPLEFAFEDYNQKQLREILQGMVKARGMQLGRKKISAKCLSAMWCPGVFTRAPAKRASAMLARCATSWSKSSAVNPSASAR
jgi:hypothetical protein